MHNYNRVGTPVLANDRISGQWGQTLTTSTNRITNVEMMQVTATLTEAVGSFTHIINGDSLTVGNYALGIGFLPLDQRSIDAEIIEVSATSFVSATAEIDIQYFVAAIASNTAAIANGEYVNIGQPKYLPTETILNGDYKRFHYNGPVGLLHSSELNGTRVPIIGAMYTVKAGTFTVQTQMTGRRKVNTDDYPRFLERRSA